jgi:hypothetical protein
MMLERADEAVMIGIDHKGSHTAVAITRRKSRWGLRVCAGAARVGAGRWAAP